jgi:hypothetical protein
VLDSTALNYTRGTGPQTIVSKYILDSPFVPVQSNTALGFTDSPGPNSQGFTYRALLYELQQSGAPAFVSPNWFGVAIPNPDNFDLTSDVYVVLYFHPTPSQAFYDNPPSGDYNTKRGASGANPPRTDWKQLFGYVDRLGGQMTAAIQQYRAPANRLVIFPFLEQPASFNSGPQYTLQTSEWSNIIHDILQDINSNVVNGICNRTKWVILASISNGSVYLNQFLNDSLNERNSIFSNISEIWDFDSDITVPRVLVDPQGKPLRAYWQNSPGPAGAAFVALPTSTWTNFQYPSPPNERPPLPPNASNSNPRSGQDTPGSVLYHHYIRDTMFLDAVFNIENDRQLFGW